MSSECKMVGSFELITGPMSCGKTEELLRLINRALIAGRKVKIFSPKIDTREGLAIIKSRNGVSKEAIKVSNSLEILNLVEDAELIAIDEMQFFDDEIVTVIKTLLKQGKQIIGTGLDLNFRGEPFNSMPYLLCYATSVKKLYAICMKCKNEFGSRTQRLIDGKPAKRTDPLITIEGENKKESYEARCINCHEVAE